MNEQVLTITTSACAVSLVISTPSLSSVPIITSASTRFLAQPSEITPTRIGRSLDSCFIKDRLSYPRESQLANSIWRRDSVLLPASSHHSEFRHPVHRSFR